MFSDVKRSSTEHEKWDVFFNVDGETCVYLYGIDWSEELSIKARTWNYDGHIPQIQDPFNPYNSFALINSIQVPVEKV